MLKGSGDRIIPNMEGPGHVQVPWMEGRHHEPKQDSIKFKDSVCAPEGCLFLEVPVVRATHVGPSSVSKNYQGTLGYRLFTPRSRLHSDFNYTHNL